MPAFVAGFTAFFTGATVVGVTATLGYLTALAVFNAALGAIARKLTSKKGHENTGQRFQRDVTVRATDAYDVFVYGRALVGGVTVYHNAIPDSNGVNNRMHHVVKWAGHECASLSAFRLDDRSLDPANCDWTPRSYDFVGEAGLVTTGEFRGTTTASGPTFMRWYMGDQRSADLRLAGQSDEWTAAHIGQGQTYGILEIHQVDEAEQTSKVYQKGFPQTIAAVLHGKKVYDHRRYALNRDPGLLETNSWWRRDASSLSAIGVTSWEFVEGIGGANDYGLQITNNDAGTDLLFHEPVPVNPSSKYTVFMTARRSIGERPVFWGVSFWTDNGDNISGFSGLNWPNQGTFWYLLANTQIPADWTDLRFAVGSGDAAIPSSARLMRVGFWGVSSHASFATNTTQVQIQDMGVYLGTGSRHLVNVASTWQYSESPPFCVADYLTDERLGFGKRLRVPVNPSRYAKNGDPGFRRRNTLTSGLYWRAGEVGSIGISNFASLTAVTGAPVGRLALVVAGSAGTGAIGHDFESDGVPVDPSGHYTAFLQARQDGDHAASISVHWQTDVGSSAGFTIIHPTGSPLPAVWSQFVVSLGSGTGNAIPASARLARLRASCVRSIAGAGDTQQYFQDYRLMVGTQDRHFIEPHEQIFWPSVSSAAAYTDAIVATPSGDQVRFACNGAGHTGAGHRSNVRDLLSSFNGRCVYVQSGFHISAGWEEPTKTLNKSDFRKGGMKIRAKAEMLDRYNHVRGAFYDPDNEFKRVPTATVTAAEYMARDSSQQLFHDVFLPFTNDWFMAQRIAFGILEQGDNQQLVEFQLKHSALDLMPGKVVGINNDIVSWQNHTLRMVDMETDLKKGVKLFGREDYEASYVDVGTSEYFSRNFTGVTSAAPIVPQVSSVTVTPRDGGIQLNWNNPAARSFEWIDVYRRTTNAFSGSTLIKSTRNDEYFDTLQAGQTQFYWFQTRDFANNVSSVFPGLVSSFSAAGLFPVARDPEYVFFEEFRYQSLAEFEQKWDLSVNSSVITFANTGTVGGKVFHAGSDALGAGSNIRIPYDPDALYQMRVKVRQSRATVNSDGSEFFCGLIGYQADGETPIDTTSTHVALGHRFVRNAWSLENSGPGLGSWVEYTGHVRGHMAWPTSGTVHRNLSEDPKLAARMHDLVRYVSPEFFVNWNNGDGAQEIDYISIRKLIPFRTVTFDPEITAQSNWLIARSVADIGVNSVDRWAVQSITNLNVDGEYSVLPISQPFSSGEGDYMIAERFRPGFHARLPSSGAYMANIRVRVTSFDSLQSVQFRPGLVVYTRTGSAFGFADVDSVQAIVTPGSNNLDSLDSNLWHDVAGTITVNGTGVSSGPYFLAPGCRIIYGGNLTVLNSSWIAYFNITPGNP